jgi:hypothetical protein
LGGRSGGCAEQREGIGWGTGVWRGGEGGGGGGARGVRAPVPSSFCAAAAAPTCPPADSARLAYPPGSETTTTSQSPV